MGSILRFFVFCFTLMMLVHCQTIETAKKNDSKSKVLQSKIGIIVSYINSGNLRTALKEVKQLKRYWSDHHDVYLIDGLIHLALDNNNKAEQAFKRSYEIKESISPLLNLSSVYLKSKKYTSAIQTLKKIEGQMESEKYKFPERVYLNLGIAYSHQNDHVNSVKYLKRSVEENPTYHMGWVELGREYESKGKRRSALESYKKGVQFCKNCIEPTAELSKFYLRNNKNIESVKLLTRFLKFKKIDKRHKKIVHRLLKVSRKKFLR